MLLNEGKYGFCVNWHSKEMRLYGESKLSQYAGNLFDMMANKAVYISELFQVEGPFAMDVYLFSDERKYNDFLKSKEHTFKVEPYKKAAYNENTIVILYDESKIPNKLFHYSNVFAHMYFHMLNQLAFKHSGNDSYGTLWYEEGLAQLVSGERNKLEDEELYKKVLLRKVFDEQWKIPMIDELFEHGHDKFDNDDFNGYTISYMLVRYLRDHFTDLDYYRRVSLGFSKKIVEMNNDIISRAYNYYGTLLGLPGFQVNLSAIRTPEDLFEYMELYIKHGWIDINGERHEHSLEGIREIYKINSLEQVLESGLATCIEQTMLEHYVLDSLGINNKIFVNRYLERDENSNKKVRMHCFCAYKVKFGWCYFEHANKSNKGIRLFFSLRDLCDYHLKKMADDRFLTEIPEIPVGYTISEFNDYVNTFKLLGRGHKIR